LTERVPEVSFLQKGRGKDIVFLHGYLSSKEAFTAQIAYFSRFFRVTAIDFLGFGKSPPLTEAFSVADYAKWTAEILTALGVQKPHIVAHSFGCRVAIKMAGEGLFDFDKMLLTGPAGVILRRTLAYRVKVWAYRVCKKVCLSFAERRFGSAEYRGLSPVMKESYKKIVNEDLRATATRVQNEVLIVEGNADRTTPIKEARAYLNAFPNARLCVTEGGHFAFAEHPVAFNLIAEEFFYG
jgi:pimeloyl-ACP methyl ester carboxylesterase